MLRILVEYQGVQQRPWGIDDLAGFRSDPTLILFLPIVRPVNLAKP